MNPGYRPLLRTMESLLDEDSACQLKNIFAPKIVAVPPQDTRCALCVMPDGEIRCYGAQDKTSFSDWSHPIYLSSRDCGLSWKKIVPDRMNAGAGIRLSDGTYLSVVAAQGFENGVWLRGLGEEKGLFAIRASSPDDSDFERIKITDEPVYGMYMPVELDSGRVLCPAHIYKDGMHRPVCLISDDFGKTWRYHILTPAPKFVPEWPHLGCRWQNAAAEPTLIPLPDGRIWMLARTAQDVFYNYYSSDEGESWTEPEPSRFHGVLTSPQLFGMTDGTILLFFNNTQPLPEVDHTTQRPALRPNEISGEGGEDVFTNRDANHGALTRDGGKTWSGFREIALNLIRNDADFRTKSLIPWDTRDKSVHQFQAIELPFGKILLSYGQNEISRKLVILDAQWLTEKKKEENFKTGLQGVSTQVYLKSVPGNFRGAGHCAYNRTNGAVLMPDPEENFEEAVFLSRIRDPRLLSETQGVVWNFPATQKGRVTVRLRIDGGPIHLALCDRWFNPVDETVPFFAKYHRALAAADLPEKTFSVLELEWDLSTQKIVVSLNGILWKEETVADAENGISYLILQSPYAGTDFEGAYLKSLSFEDLV